MSTTAKFRTEGMHCNSCKMLVEMSIEELAGVESVEVSLPDSTTRVVYEPELLDFDAIIKAIGNIRHPSTLLEIKNTANPNGGK